MRRSKKIYVKINPGNIVYTNYKPEEIAFMYFIEQVNNHLKNANKLGMVFGDYDEPVIGSSVASLSRFREGGTYWRKGQEIENIIDTVHFAQSHHSRLIQLADIFLYSLQFQMRDANAEWREAFKKIFVEKQLDYGCIGKEWPTQPEWYR